jgi:hypothetical protein
MIVQGLLSILVLSEMLAAAWLVLWSDQRGNCPADKDLVRGTRRSYPEYESRIGCVGGARDRWPRLLFRALPPYARQGARRASRRAPRLGLWYPGQQYPCWIVLNDSGHSGAVIAYCEFGFGPKCPWGLVGSGDAPADSQMGMGSGWFASFLNAYFESFAAPELPIWKVYRQEADLTLVQLTPEGT